jgi:EXPERA (EXPanded EBP superfamily)
MPTAADVGRAVALAFFASHIPVTLFVDSQAGAWSMVVWLCVAANDAWTAKRASLNPHPPHLFSLFSVLPRTLYPTWATSAFDWYVATYKDPLMVARPPWFRALVWLECAVQFPFFIYAAAAFARRDHRVRPWAAAYGISTATTLVPIMAELAATAPAATKHTLLAFYAPYAIIPAVIGAWMLTAKGDPFGAKRSKSKRR